LGGDGVVTLTEIMDQTIVGIYWAYEGLRFWARRRGCRTRSPPTLPHGRERKPTPLTHHHAIQCLDCSFTPLRLGRATAPLAGLSPDFRLFFVEQINCLRAGPAIAEQRAVEKIALQHEGFRV
jgi:hypothetical protein